MNTTILLVTANDVKGCQFAHVNYISDVKLSGGKKNPLNGHVTKLVSLNCQFNYDYEKAVNNRLKKQGMQPTFSANSLPWGTWLIPNKVITHNGINYLRVYEVSGNNKAEVTYYIDGIKATDAEITAIKATLPQKPMSGTQGAAGLTTHQVSPKNIKFENILEFTCNGQTYINEQPRMVV